MGETQKEKLLCPECLKPLEYHGSRFEQYQPSEYYCEAHGRMGVPYVKGFNKGYNCRPEPPQKDSGLVELDEKKLLIYLLGITPRSVPLDREEIESLSTRIYNKFGSPKQLSLEEIEKELWNEEERCGFKPAYKTLAQAIYNAQQSRFMDGERERHC